VEHVGDVAGGPGSHGVGAAIFDRFFFFFLYFLVIAREFRRNGNRNPSPAYCAFIS